jgi:hypothetical protein
MSSDKAWSIGGGNVARDLFLMNWKLEVPAAIRFSVSQRFSWGKQRKFHTQLQSRAQNLCVVTISAFSNIA